MPTLSELSEREILALAIATEEEDGHIYADYAHMLQEKYPDSAALFREMAEEENVHRRQLIDLYHERFGPHVLLVRRQDILGFPRRKSAWQMKNRNISAIRAQAEVMEQQAAQFYRKAASLSRDAGIRKLLGDLASIEERHRHEAAQLENRLVTEDVQAREDEIGRRDFLLRIVQPGLVGLMDGSVSTLAPVFAAAFATHDAFSAFQVGLAASVGAAISMGLAEALADDGKLSGRGSSLARGVLCGAMTFAGGIFHTLPFLVPDFHLAFTLAVIVVAVELFLISWIRWKYQDTPFSISLVQVVLGGALVFGAGVLIGSS
ncbi:rubrerythrin [Oecophyllibacter saccharovorans]|uniref:iron exporter MbfA n=1 Tax=Oecophyllibacter saccharovorans TaxID=2558360 RepID=UPI001144EF5E|nr:ferritin family protein [Oecophyllibacter saccharovorans]QDH14569.1 rubrerythrin [Oecophyllibacter saccharovorans]